MRDTDMNDSKGLSQRRDQRDAGNAAEEGRQEAEKREGRLWWEGDGDHRGSLHPSPTKRRERKTDSFYLRQFATLPLLIDLFC